MQTVPLSATGTGYTVVCAEVDGNTLDLGHQVSTLL